MLTAKQRQKRVNCAQSILNWLKSNPHRPIVISDEKNWNVDMHLNRRNDRYLAANKADVDPSVCFIAKSKFPAEAAELWPCRN